MLKVGLVGVGGISGAQSDVVPNPVLLLMDNGETQAIPDYSDFTWTGSAGTVNTTTGAITIDAASGDIAVAAQTSLGRADLTAVINVEVE